MSAASAGALSSPVPTAAIVRELLAASAYVAETDSRSSTSGLASSAVTGVFEPVVTTSATLLPQRPCPPPER